MEADVVVVNKGLTQGVGRLHSTVGGIQGVVAQMGGGGVGGLADKDGLFDRAAVAAAIAVEGVARRGVDHETDVHPVQNAAVHELLLAAKITDDTLLLELLAEVNFNKLLGRDGDEADGAAQALQSAGGLQTSGYAQQGGALAVVAAGVDSAGLGITLGVRGDDERVHLAEHGDAGAGTAGVNIGPETGDVARLGDGVTQFLKLFFHIGVGLPLPVAGLGVGPDVSLGGQDGVLMAFDGLEHKFQHKKCLLGLG